MKHDERIFKRLREHYDAIKDEHEVVGIFLQGSQNYGLDVYDDDYQSDIDSKAIVLPTLDDILYNRSPKSTTKILDNNEHIDIKDVQVIFDTFKKQNINFIEILFTKYKIINPKYRDIVNELLAHNEEIAHLNTHQAIRCMVGMSKEKLKAMKHPYPNIIEKIEKYGYDCYSDNTKFLTLEGWKTYYEISDFEKIATFNSKNKQIEFANFTNRFCENYSGSLYDIETWNSHFLVTENHNVYTSPININKFGAKYKKTNDKWMLKPLNAILENNRDSKHRHLAVNINNNEDLCEYENIKITDDVLKLIGAFVSEGSVDYRENKKIKSIKLYQSDMENIHQQDFIKMVDSINGINLKKYKYNARSLNKHDEIIWISHDKIKYKIVEWCKHKSKNKRLPPFIYKLSKRQANILLNSLCLGDGTIQKSRDIYYTISLKLAEDVQTLCLYAERYSVIMGINNKYIYENSNFANSSEIYQVAIKKSDYIPNSCYFKEKKNLNLIEYNGNIVCFDVPNSILITSYSGKIAIQGNSKQLHHIVRMNEFLNKYVQGKTYSECLQSDNKEYLIGIKKSILNLEDAEKLALEYDGATYDLKQQVVIGDDKVDNNAIDILNKIKADLIKRHLVAELKQSTEIKEQPFVPKNIFVISDNHFYHENVIEFEQRPFKNVEDMNTQMVAKWNSVVQDGDLVYILGDFSFGNARQTNEILGRLNGKKILIVGNHDLFINDKKFDNTLFFDIKHYEEIELNGTKYTMTHYPFASNNDKGIFLHGHIHSNNGVHKVDNLPKNSINVGVDVNNYTPINIESIKMI